MKTQTNKTVETSPEYLEKCHRTVDSMVFGRPVVDFKTLPLNVKLREVRKQLREARHERMEESYTSNKRGEEISKILDELCALQGRISSFVEKHKNTF